MTKRNAKFKMQNAKLSGPAVGIISCDVAIGSPDPFSIYSQFTGWASHSPYGGVLLYQIEE